MNKVSAIILAAGSGSRFGEKKQFKELNGKPIWFYSLNNTWYLKPSTLRPVSQIVSDVSGVH